MIYKLITGGAGFIGSRVNRSIRDPFTFARTNVMGTLSLLQAAKEYWNGDYEGKRFYPISTDEVYGALEFTKPDRESDGTRKKRITYVADCAGYDLRYAIDFSKLKNELGWESSPQFEESIERTVKWYFNNQKWIRQRSFRRVP